MATWEPVIGLEIHIELNTKSKMFCSCSADYFGTEPNTHTCPICLGLPGAMPKANEVAIESVQKLGLVLGCELRLDSKFDRKNYFYPDLAKGFQISQYDLPFSETGKIKINIDGKSKTIGITRAHMEEDTGKLTHATIDGKRVTLIDFNRSGVPLIEIVSDPDMNSSAEAKAYAQKIHQIAKYLKISDADMEKGSMRIEPNVSLRKAGEKGLPEYKVELKNINSFRFAEKAIEYEVKRQTEILDSEETPAQETRGWNETKNETFSQRSKEEAHDYRYFPEPDLPPFEFTKDHIEKLRSSLPELPDTKFERFQKEYGLSDYDAEILTRDIGIANYFEEAAKAGKEAEMTPKHVANIMINQKPDMNKVLPATLIKNYVSAKQTSPVDEDKLNKVINKVIEENQKAVEDFKNGKENILMFLIGSVMKKMATKLDANLVKELLLKKLK